MQDNHYSLHVHQYHCRYHHLDMNLPVLVLLEHTVRQVFVAARCYSQLADWLM